MTKIILKNPNTNWKKTISWNWFDVNHTFGTELISYEEVSVGVNKEDFIGILSQEKLVVRVQGKDYYRDYSFDGEKLVKWRSFLESKMN